VSPLGAPYSPHAAAPTQPVTPSPGSGAPASARLLHPSPGAATPTQPVTPSSAGTATAATPNAARAPPVAEIVECRLVLISLCSRNGADCAADTGATGSAVPEGLAAWILRPRVVAELAMPPAPPDGQVPPGSAETAAPWANCMALTFCRLFAGEPGAPASLAAVAEADIAAVVRQPASLQPLLQLPPQRLSCLERHPSLDPPSPQGPTPLSEHAPPATGYPASAKAALPTAPESCPLLVCATLSSAVSQPAPSAVAPDIAGPAWALCRWVIDLAALALPPVTVPKLRSLADLRGAGALAYWAAAALPVCCCARRQHAAWPRVDPVVVARNSTASAATSDFPSVSSVFHAPATAAIEPEVEATLSEALAGDDATDSVANAMAASPASSTPPAPPPLSPLPVECSPGASGLHGDHSEVGAVDEVPEGLHLVRLHAVVDAVGGPVAEGVPAGTAEAEPPPLVLLGLQTRTHRLVAWSAVPAV